MSPAFKGLMIILAALLVLCLLPGQVTLIYGALLSGWVMFPLYSLGRINIDSVAAISAVTCLAAVTVGVHWLGLWLYCETAPAGAQRRWRRRWSGAIVGIVVLMFAAGTSMVAITHQLLWLARSPEPIILEQNRRETANRVKCAANMRTIGQAILLYAKDHEGHYPDRLEDLFKFDIISETFICPSSDDESAPGSTPAEWAANLSKPNHLSYIYIGRGLTHSTPVDRPVLYERDANHNNDGMNILFVDGHVKWFNMDEARKILSLAAPPTTAAAP